MGVNTRDWCQPFWETVSQAVNIVLLIISNNSDSELTSIIVWLAAIQLISYRNSRTPFSNESMIYKLKSDLKTILSSLKGTTRGSLWGLFDNPRPPETGS